MAGDLSRLRVSDLISRKVLAIGDGYRAKNSEMSLTGIPFARAGNIDGGISFNDADYIDISAIPVPEEKISRPGDTVFTSKGTVGRFAFVKQNTRPFIYSPQLCYWRSLDKNLIDPKYLYYWLSGAEFYTQYKGVSGQTDMAEYVSLGDQRQMWITLPDPADQMAIGEMLGFLDDKIDVNRRVAATLEEMSRALFKSWFVDFDPVCVQAGCRDTGLPADTAGLFPNRLGDNGLPEGWQFQPMLDQADWVNGAAYKDMHFSDAPDALPVIKIAELKNGITDSTKHTNTDLGDRYKIAAGELLFSWSGSPDTSIDAFIWVNGDAWLNQHIFAVRSNGQAPLSVLFSMLKHFKPELIEIARDKQTTGLGHITRQDLARLRVSLGGPDILAAFDKLTDSVFRRLQAVLLENQKLAQLRDALLPKLISGELRIKDAEKAVAA
ncbi:restriction endonuclease subunit S [Mesorhizobium sp. M1334]|uniref:restriction endonuclease subunit S n=1 Tax=Mesorhizobium sp. M1334 TaxID=2957084 RepID=UPI00333827B0